MKRETKFRGRRTDTGEWVYGLFTNKKIGNLIVPVIDVYHEWDSGDYMESHEVDGDTVGEYIGLRDKNGKEIYEGDVVKLDNTKSKHDGTLFRVDFRMGSFEMQNDDGMPPLSFIYLAVQLRAHDAIKKDSEAMNYIEVIGNIYENPEMIKA